MWVVVGGSGLLEKVAVGLIIGKSMNKTADIAYAYSDFE
jgi:hypothetical protein